MKRPAPVGLTFCLALMTQTRGQIVPSVAIFLDKFDYDVFSDTAAMFNETMAEMVTLHNITGLTPFELFHKACSVASTGAVAIATQATCPTVVTLSYIADTLGLTYIADDVSCDNEDSIYHDDDEHSIALESANQPDLSMALAATLKALDWHDVLVIYDNHDGYAHDVYLSRLGGEIVAMNGFIEMFEVNDISLSSDIGDILQYIMSREVYRQVLIVCSITCIKETLRMAVNIDRSKTVQELFSFALKWLILADEDDLDNILSDVQTLNHVTVVTPPSQKLMSYSVINSLMEKVNQSVTDLMNTNDWDWETQITVCGTKLALVNGTEQLQVNYDNLTSTNKAPFVYYAAMWKPGQVRQFEEVAQWSGEEALTFDDIFPNVKHGLNGKHLIVGTNLWDPFVVYDFNSTTGYSGYCMDLLNMMSSYLNFTYEMKEPDDGHWGTYYNGSFNGLIGELIDKKVDVVVAPLVASPVRSHFVDFSKAFFVETHSAIAKYPDPSKNNWRIYLDPFNWDVWTCVLLSVPAAAIVLWAFHRLSAEYDSIERKKRLGQLNESMWYSFGTLLTQGSDILPTAQSGRFVVGFWLMYCLVVISSYSGNLVAFFTVSNPTLPFTTLKEVVDSDYKIGVAASSYVYLYVMESDRGVFKEVADRIRFFNETDPDVLSDNNNQQMAKVRGEKYVYLVDSTTIQAATSRDCSLDKLKQNFIPVEYAIAFWKHSAYKEPFDQGLELFIESGFEKRWRQDWWPYLSTCDRGLVTSSKPVSVSDMQGAFYLMAIVLVTAMVSLFLELGVQKAQRGKDENAAEDQSTEMTWNQVRFDQYEQQFTQYAYS